MTTRTTCPRCGEYTGDCDAACLRSQVAELRATVKKLNRRAQAAEACPACRRAVEERDAAARAAELERTVKT